MREAHSRLPGGKKRESGAVGRTLEEETFPSASGRAGSRKKHKGFDRESPGNQPGPSTEAERRIAMILLLVGLLLFGKVTVTIAWHRKGRR
jgi:hypothetical protein